MAYVLQGVVGGFGYGGIGNDAKKTALKNDRLQIQVEQGVPGAKEALAEAIRLQPAQALWDLKAEAMRAAGMDQVNALPAIARPTAQRALESSIIRALGPRPEARPPAFFAAQASGGSSDGSSPGSGFMDFLTGKSEVEIGGKKVSSTTLIVGALVIGGVAYALTR